MRRNLAATALAASILGAFTLATAWHPFYGPFLLIMGGGALIFALFVLVLIRNTWSRRDERAQR